MPPRYPAAALLLALLAPPAARAQSAPPRGEDVRAEVFAGSELERYLRVLQLTRAAAPPPLGVRPWSPAQVARAAPDSGATHPWARRVDFAGDGRRRLWAVGPSTALAWNSAIPYGSGDGPVWAGRGATVSASGGAGFAVGPLTVVVAPLVFVAENRAFPLAPVGASFSPFADPVSPRQIDLPQRFGEGAYHRIDPGESTARLDAGAVSLGVSTAAQQWGPAVEQPLVLGPDAGGFPHLFAGSARPVNVGIGRVHGRLVWGSLAQSSYSSVQGDSSRRFMSGWVVTFAPRGLPGLEVGATRFYHTPWPAGGVGVREFLKPFEDFLKAELDTTGFGGDNRSDVSNQLASAFVRWVLPGAGAEVYGEYAREDHSWDLLDFMLEPDHNSAYTLGFQKAWRPEPTRMTVLRGEVMNARPSHLGTVRHQTRFYRHGFTRQGHTLRGQLLGAPAGYGGAAAMVAVDRYDPTGRWTLRLSRSQRGERDTGADAAGAATPPDSLSRVDVVSTAGVERVFLAPFGDVNAAATGVWERDRDFTGEDRFNLNLRLGLRVRL